MKLIDEWRDAWRFLSVQLSVLGSALAATWVLLPKEQQEAILSLIGVDGPGVLAMVGFLAIVWGRLKAQDIHRDGGHS